MTRAIPTTKSYPRRRTDPGKESTTEETQALGGKLCDVDVGGTNVKQSVSYREDDGITIYGSDFGAAPKKFFGSSEYEYARMVKPKYVDRVFFELLKESGAPHERFSSPRLIELIVDRFAGSEKALTQFQEWCEGRAIPVETWAWSSGF